LTHLQRKVGVLPEVKYFLAFLFPEETSTSSLSLEVLKKARLSPENMTGWEMQNAMPIQIKVSL
jgi:hypothetical protein